MNACCVEEKHVNSGYFGFFSFLLQNDKKKLLSFYEKKASLSQEGQCCYWLYYYIHTGERIEVEG